MARSHNDILDYEKWSAHELEIADTFITICHTAIDHAIAELFKVDVLLPDDKRTVIEMVVLLEAAAKIARDKLEISADDFAVSACEVFQRSTAR